MFWKRFGEFRPLFSRIRSQLIRKFILSCRNDWLIDCTHCHYDIQTFGEWWNIRQTIETCENVLLDPGDQAYLNLLKGYNLPGKPNQKLIDQRCGPFLVRARYLVISKERNSQEKHELPAQEAAADVAIFVQEDPGCMLYIWYRLRLWMILDDWQKILLLPREDAARSVIMFC